MLNCREIAEQSSDYIDKQMPLRKRMGVRMHLLMCAICRRYMTHLSTVITMFGKKKLTTSEEEVEVVMGTLASSDSGSDAS